MDAPPVNLYTVRDVARLFGLHESRIRYWAQTGFINPSGSDCGRRLYTFIDILSVKAAKELLDRGIPLQRVRKNLQALREASPQLERPLAQLRVCSDGENLIVAHKEGTFDPLSGQRLLDFEVDDLRKSLADILQLSPVQPPPAAATPGAGTILAEPAAADAPAMQAPASDARTRRGKRRAPEDEPAAQPGGQAAAPTATPASRTAAPTVPAGEERPSTAYGWFLLGCRRETEESGEPEAIAAYTKALELDPGLASAHTNLGNVHYRQGDRARALHHYQAACALDPDQPEAHYNLANLFEEEDDLEMAIAEHRRALASNPDFADAHFNLALVLERVGSRVQALSHWRRFLELFPEGGEEEWRSLARKRVELLEVG